MKFGLKLQRSKEPDGLRGDVLPEAERRRSRKKKKDGAGRRHSPLRIAGRILLISAVVFVGIIVMLAIRFFRFDEWHQFDPSLILDCEKSVCVYDSSGELVSVVHGGENRIWVEIETLPRHVVNAFVSAEDARFYSHSGVDIIRVFGAAWADIKAGELEQGASTLSQQLIKLSHLTSEKTFDRKVEEAFLSLQMERQFEKDEIMEMYLNYVYFGGGFYGIETAALGYFGVHASELTIAQAAQLAGILKAPSRFAPHLDMEKSLDRRSTVLDLMLEYGHITAEEHDRAADEPCILVNSIPALRNTYIDYALSEACELMDMDMDTLLVSGSSIYTALDNDMNEYSQALFGTDSLFPCEEAQGAAVVLNSAGEITAMVGGRGEYEARGFNRVCDMQRQPGSLIKPILCYAPAMELMGYTAATPINDEKQSFGDYSPKNSDDEYYGWITLRGAVTRSLNVPAVMALSDVGLSSACRFAQSIGVSMEGEHMSLALALGGFTYGVSPLEMAEAYSTFARGGIHIEAHAVRSIVKADGEIFEQSTRGERVMSEQNAFILTSMLQSVASEGTGRRLNSLNLPIAAKTGTSLDENGNVRDVWTAAYTSEYTAVMWMGTDSAQIGTLPEGTTGGNSACGFLAELFAHIYAQRPADGFSVPEGVVECSIDMDAIRTEHGVFLASEYTPESSRRNEYFTAATAPSAASPYWSIPSPPSNVAWRLNEAGKPIICFSAESEHILYRIERRDISGAVFVAANISGVTGGQEFADTTAVPGEMYFYTVYAIHTGIAAEGKNARSGPSRTIFVFVPFS